MFNIQQEQAPTVPKRFSSLMTNQKYSSGVAQVFSVLCFVKYLIVIFSLLMQVKPGHSRISKPGPETDSRSQDRPKRIPKSPEAACPTLSDINLSRKRSKSWVPVLTSV